MLAEVGAKSVITMSGPPQPHVGGGGGKGPKGPEAGRCASHEVLLMEGGENRGGGGKRT